MGRGQGNTEKSSVATRRACLTKEALPTTEKRRSMENLFSDVMGDGRGLRGNDLLADKRKQLVSESRITAKRMKPPEGKHQPSKIARIVAGEHGNKNNVERQAMVQKGVYWFGCSGRGCTVCLPDYAPHLSKELKDAFEAHHYPSYVAVDPHFCDPNTGTVAPIAAGWYYDNARVEDTAR